MVGFKGVVRRKVVVGPREVEAVDVTCGKLVRVWLVFKDVVQSGFEFKPVESVDGDPSRVSALGVVGEMPDNEEVAYGFLELRHCCSGVPQVDVASDE
ncbi:hypothetical protein CEXT_526951 [Caerostris extrusa]|uniref:Uncharacterized protein n=1 Tax=Caerostris extrusa TaxID=172846 RepID=A0AAV4VBA9_CAEEX|nr:hypothetical protein CEXT_526951 [Caerostris extrusa]